MQDTYQRYKLMISGSCIRCRVGGRGPRLQWDNDIDDMNIFNNEYINIDKYGILCLNTVYKQVLRSVFREIYVLNSLK